jgi:hypothetical protein
LKFAKTLRTYYTRRFLTTSNRRTCGYFWVSICNSWIRRFNNSIRVTTFTFAYGRFEESSVGFGVRNISNVVLHDRLLSRSPWPYTYTPRSVVVPGVHVEPWIQLRSTSYPSSTRDPNHRVRRAGRHNGRIGVVIRLFIFFIFSTYVHVRKYPARSAQQEGCGDARPDIPNVV